ncbi:MAG: Nif11-like leader peptide family RiPP precursor, partial [Eubacteriales bacterium]|nr:Nif11-like leader peptide family RiPP precursor [Eubacteriales bacterium]
MSTMKELYLKVAADESLQAKVNKIFETAKEQGFDVTVEEIFEFFNSGEVASGSQMSDEELDSVAGGYT